MIEDYPDLFAFAREQQLRTRQRARSIVGDDSDGGRPSDDFYPTPPIAVEKLLDHIEFEPLSIWEPACGDGAICKVFIDHGYTTFASDKYDHGYGSVGIDFLTTKKLLSPNIVTNPPFCLAKQFVTHSMDLGARKLALLCKLAFLEGQKRAAILESTPLKHVMVFRKRLTLTRNGVRMKNGGMIAFAWFVWEREYRGQPLVSWL